MLPLAIARPNDADRLLTSVVSGRSGRVRGERARYRSYMPIDRSDIRDGTVMIWAVPTTKTTSVIGTTADGSIHPLMSITAGRRGARYS